MRNFVFVIIIVAFVVALSGCGHSEIEAWPEPNNSLAEKLEASRATDWEGYYGEKLGAKTSVSIGRRKSDENTVKTTAID